MYCYLMWNMWKLMWTLTEISHTCVYRSRGLNKCLILTCLKTPSGLQRVKLNQVWWAHEHQLIKWGALNASLKSCSLTAVWLTSSAVSTPLHRQRHTTNNQVTQDFKSPVHVCLYQQTQDSQLNLSVQIGKHMKTMCTPLLKRKYLVVWQRLNQS